MSFERVSDNSFSSPDSNIIEMREKFKDPFLKKHGVKLGFMSPFLKASAYALKDQPVVNAVIDEQEIVYRDYVDISVAVATPKGLVVPVLRNVEVMDCADIEKALFELGEKVGRLFRGTTIFRCCVHFRPAINRSAMSP